MVLLFPVVALVAAAGAGAGERLAVVDVAAPDTMMGLAAQVTRAVLSAAEAQHLAVMTPDELRAALKPKQLDDLRKCAGAPACVAQALEGLPVKAAVVGTLDRDERNYLLKLWLVDLKTLTTVADVDRAILIAARRFQKDVDEAVPRLLRGEKEARGVLVISCNVPDATVTVNGEPVGPPGTKLTLKPGKYEVKLERRKYLPVTRLLAVEANQESVEKIALLLRPGEVPDAVNTTTTHHVDEGKGPGISAPTWICGGLTVAAAGAGLAFGLVAQGQAQKLVDGYSATTQTYAGTRADALAARQSAVVADVLYGVAGAALIATVIFAVRDGVSQNAVQVTPTVSGTGAGLSVGGQF